LTKSHNDQASTSTTNQASTSATDQASKLVKINACLLKLIFRNTSNKMQFYHIYNNAGI